MDPTLRSGDLARLEAASRALVSPLAAPSVDAWRQQVLESMCALFGGRSAMFALPHPDVPFYASTGIDSSAIRDMTNHIAERARNVGDAPDPLINRFYQRREELNLEVFDADLMLRVTGEGPQAQRKSEFYNEVWARHGLHRVHVLYVTTPQGVANLHVHHDPGRPPFGGEGGLAVLRVMLPSFKAGLDALQRLTSHRTTLLSTFDVVSEPLAAFDADGRELYRNAAFRCLLAEEPERAALDVALERLARSLRRLAYPRRGDVAEPPASLEHTVRTARGRYVLRPSVLPEGLLAPGNCFVVTVQASLAPRPLAPEDIQERFGLTRREAEVAVLLAAGLRNDEIADRLFIAPGTARRHTENVLAKLGVASRASVGAQLHGTA